MEPIADFQSWLGADMPANMLTVIVVTLAAYVGGMIFCGTKLKVPAKWLPVWPLYPLAAWPIRRLGRWWRGRKGKPVEAPARVFKLYSSIVAQWPDGRAVVKYGTSLRTEDIKAASLEWIELGWREITGSTEATDYLGSLDTKTPDTPLAASPAPASQGDTVRVRAWRCVISFFDGDAWVRVGGDWFHRANGVWRQYKRDRDWVPGAEQEGMGFDGGWQELPPPEAEALNAERLAGEWGPEGVQRAYRDCDLGTVRFYPSFQARLARAEWTCTLMPESQSASEHTRLPDAESLAIWKTRPRNGSFDAGIIDDPLPPKPAYNVGDGRIEGIRRDVAKLESKIEELAARKPDPVHDCTHPMAGQVWVKGDYVSKVVTVTGVGTDQHVFYAITYCENPTKESLAERKWHPLATFWPGWLREIAHATRRPDLEEPCDSHSPPQG